MIRAMTGIRNTRIIRLYSRSVLPNNRVMLNHRRMLASAALFLCAVATALADAPAQPAPSQSPYIVDVWESGAGDQKLPQSSVIAITQTRDGYLWLGTLGGLVRFDGTRFTVFNKANTAALDNRIVFLFEDSRTNLWVGTETAGIVLIQSDGKIQRFEAARGNRESRLVDACEDSAGDVWLLTHNGLLCRYQTNSLAVTPVGCKTIIATDESGLVIGTDNGLFAAPAPGRNAFVQLAPVNGRLDYLLASKTGGYWRLADGRVQKWKGSKMVRDLGPYPWSSMTQVKAACEDADGDLIVGTQPEGVFWFDADGRATQISTEQGLSKNSRGIVLSLCMDREGNLWAGTDGGGLNRIKKRLFHVLAGSEDWTVQSVCQDAGGGLWVGTFGDGVNYFKDDRVLHFGADQSSTNLNLEKLSVRSVFADHADNVLVGTLDYGLCQIAGGKLVQILNPQIGSAAVPPIFRFYDRTGAPWLGAQPTLTAIYEDRSHRLWFGTQAGLVCRDESGWKRYTTRDGLSSDSVRAIVEDERGDIWIGTENGGLNRLSDGRVTAVRRADGFAGETITSLHASRGGALWIGTDGAGLQRLQNGRWSTFFRRNGLLSDSIGYLIEDTRSNLWMGSYAGLTRVSIRALNDFADGKSDFISCRAFGTSDGLLTSECTQGSQPAACMSRDGRLWFPTASGLVAVNPADIKPNTNRSPVIIESVLVESQEQNTNQFGSRLQSVTIPSGKERLEIYYTSLNFSAPENVRFKYQMSPHESHWIEAGNNRTAVYTKLPPGNYEFRVVAYNEDGVESGRAATLAVMVLPAFWQTATFRIGAVLLLLGIIGGAIYYFSTQKLQRELAVMKQHEALERERARIARDLHDQLGANLTQVTLLAEMAEADKELPMEVESHAQQICQTARETTHSLDEIVWAINPSNDTLEGLVNYACKYAQEYLELAGISHRFEVPAELPKTDIAPDVRHNVFLAFKESVNNVVKHAQATSVWIRLHLKDHSFTLEVQDDGRGLPDLDGKSLRSGLRNMRKRMEDVGGSFSIGPAPEKGTTVRLTAPTANG